MEGFVLLGRESAPGDVWVRRTDISAVQLLHVRSIEGEWTVVSVLAGGTWFRDRATYPTTAAAQARAAELAATATSSRSRLVAAVGVLLGRR